MTIDIISFLVGSSFILIAVIGGGFDIKFLKIPQVSARARVFSLIGGLFFIILGLSLSGRIDSEGNIDYVEQTDSQYQQNSNNSNQTPQYTQLFCCNSVTGQKVCPINLTGGAPGLPCYCVGFPGAGIMC